MRLLLEMLGIAVACTLLLAYLAVIAYTTRVVVLWMGWCAEEDTAHTISAIVSGIVMPATLVPVMIRAVNWWVKRTGKECE